MKGKEPGVFLMGFMILITAMLLTPCSPGRAAGPELSGSSVHSVGLKSDGTVVAVGDNTYGQTNVSPWTDITAVSAGYRHTVGLKSDGTVVTVGDNYYGQTNISSWTDITAVSTYFGHTVGLKSNGTVVTAGRSDQGLTDVSLWTDITAVSAGYYHTVGLKSNGTVVAVGWNEYGQTNVSSWGTDISATAVVAGYAHTLGLKSDGTVVATGRSEEGQLNVSSWTNIVAVAPGYYHTVGLKSDGTVVAVGDNTYGQSNVSSWTDIVAVSAGWWHTLGLKSDGTVVAAGCSDSNTCFYGRGQTNVSSWQLQILGTDIKGGRGTQVILRGAGFGPKKGTVHLGTTAAKVIAWYDTRIVFETTSSLTPGEYPIYVNPKGGSTITYGKPFIMKAPELQFVQASEGHAGDLVMLTGKYFGSKKGKVMLGAKSCSVSYWFMDPTSGESMAAFKVPPKTAEGYYNITLTNEAGSAKFPMVVFTVKSGKSTHMESSPDRED